MQLCVWYVDNFGTLNLKFKCKFNGKGTGFWYFDKHYNPISFKGIYSEICIVTRDMIDDLIDGKEIINNTTMDMLLNKDFFNMIDTQTS